MAAMFYVFWMLAWQGRKYASFLGSDIHRAYIVCLSMLLVVWLCYPICWGVADGGNIIAPDSEAVFYGVLDMLAKPFFSIALLFFHRNIDPARMGLKFRDYDDDIAYHHFMPNEQNRMHGPERKEEPGAGDTHGASNSDGAATNGANQQQQTA